MGETSNDGRDCSQGYKQQRHARPRLLSRTQTVMKQCPAPIPTRARMWVLHESRRRTFCSPAVRPAEPSCHPSPRPPSPEPWFRSGAGTLQRPATASVAHLHSEIAGLSAGIARDALVAGNSPLHDPASASDLHRPGPRLRLRHPRSAVTNADAPATARAHEPDTTARATSNRATPSRVLERHKHGQPERAPIPNIYIATTPGSAPTTLSRDHVVTLQGVKRP